MQTTTAPITISDTKGSESAGLFSRTVQTLSVVATTDARAHPNRQGMIRPIAGSAVPIAPRNQLKVLEVQPALTWYRIADAPAYVVQVRRVDNGCTSLKPTDPGKAFKSRVKNDIGSTSTLPAVDATPAYCKPVRFQAGGDTTFVIPESAPLVRGAMYEWAVAPTSGGRVSEPQRFQVASEKDFTTISARLKEITAAGLDPAADGLFLAALSYRNAGLFYEARRALDKLDTS